VSVDVAIGTIVWEFLLWYSRAESRGGRRLAAISGGGKEGKIGQLRKGILLRTR